MYDSENRFIIETTESYKKNQDTHASKKIKIDIEKYKLIIKGWKTKKLTLNKMFINNGKKNFK
jgi:hypothetical protein